MCLTFYEKENTFACMCAGFKIKINGCKSFAIPDYKDNCYRLDFSGVTSVFGSSGEFIPALCQNELMYSDFYCSNLNILSNITVFDDKSLSLMLRVEEIV